MQAIYMCLYNQLTGVLKVFHYCEGHRSSGGTQWYVITGNGVDTKLLDDGEYLSSASDKPDNTDILLISNTSNSPTSWILPGWNGFELQVSYATNYANLNFIIDAYDRWITDFNFVRKEYLKTVGIITTKTHTSTP